MKMLTILEFVKVLGLYLFVTLYLPSLFLRRRLCFLSLTERVMAYFLAGNFYVINLVFLLAISENFRQSDPPFGKPATLCDCFFVEKGGGYQGADRAVAPNDP